MSLSEAAAFRDLELLLQLSSDFSFFFLTYDGLDGVQFALFCASHVAQARVQVGRQNVCCQMCRDLCPIDGPRLLSQ